MAKIGIFSDLHLHNWAYGSTPNSGQDLLLNDRLWVQQDVIINQFIPLCKEREVDEIVFCGDFFHTPGKLDTDVLNVGATILKHLVNTKVPITLLIGNHDIKSIDVGSSLDFVNQLIPSIHVIHNSGGWIRNGHSARALSYTEDHAEIYGFLNNNNSSSDVLYMHQGILGAPVGSGFLLDEYLTPEMIPDTIGHVFLGHYHNHTRVTDRITIVGAPMQHTKADINTEKGFVFYDTNTKYVSFVESKAPKFLRFNYGFLTLADKFNTKILQEQINNNFILIIDFPQNDSIALSKLRKILMEMGARSVEFEFAEPATDAKAVLTDTSNFDLDSIITEYSRDLSKKRIEVGNHIRQNQYEVP